MALISSSSFSLSACRRDVLAGLTASFALVPESIAFALVAQLNPMMGLYGAAIICFVTALLGGRPAMISGAAGSMVMVIIALVAQHGVSYFLWTVLLSGIVMMLFGLLRLSVLVRMIPHPVMLGFVNGLAIVIALSQLGHFKVDGHFLTGMPLMLMVGLVALTMAIVYLVPKLVAAIPPALIAIGVMGLAAWGLHLPTRTLGDMANMAGGWPTLSLPLAPLNMDTLKVVTPYALLMAMVGLLETLLTYNLTCEITRTKGQPNKECVALGAANVLSGLCGGMGGCAMIGQTMINLGSGGRGRLSGIVCGAMVMLYILCLSPLIAHIPLAALVGVMFVVAQQTFAWNSLRVFGRVPRSDIAIIIAVTVITVMTDLAIAVMCGVVIAALVFAWKHAGQLQLQREQQGDNDTCYRARGTLFFASTTQFEKAFSPEQDTERTLLDCQHLLLADHSAVAALDALKRRYEQEGKHLVLTGVGPRSQRLLEKAQRTPPSSS